MESHKSSMKRRRHKDTVDGLNNAEQLKQQKQGQVDIKMSHKPNKRRRSGKTQSTKVIDSIHSQMSQSVEKKLETFRRWIIQEGCILHQSVRIAQVAPDRGNGLLIATDADPIPAGTTLLKCPKNFALEARSSAFWPHIAKLLPGQELAKKLKCEVSPHDAMILCVAHELHLGQSSRWAPYLDLLPFGPGQLKVPLLWSSASIDLLKDTTLHNRYISEWTDIKSNWEANVKPIAEHFASMLALAAPVDYARIGSVLRAYAFTQGEFGSDEIRLLPLIDLMNHDCSAPTARVLHDNEKSRNGEFGVVSTKAMAPNTEILFSYGNLSNHELLIRYGFVSRTNPNDAIPITLSQAWLSVRLKLSKKLSINPMEIKRRKRVLRDMHLLESDLGELQIAANSPLPTKLRMVFRVASMSEEAMCHPSEDGLLELDAIADTIDPDEVHMLQFLSMFPCQSPKTENILANAVLLHLIRKVQRIQNTMESALKDQPLSTELHQVHTMVQLQLSLLRRRQKQISKKEKGRQT